MKNNPSVTQRNTAPHPYMLSLGLLSVACGGALLLAPRWFGALLALPANRTLLQWLGGRDVLIGSAVLLPASRRVGLALRSLSDASDGALIATGLAQHKTGAVRGGISLAVAGLSAATALWLALQRAELPAEVRT